MSYASKHSDDVNPRVYWLTRTVKALTPLLVRLSALESKTLPTRQQANVDVERPIYIFGVPRAGTTVSLEMLSQHPDVATHRYSDFSIPYLPHWSQYIVPHLGLPRLDKPVERNLRDRIKITSHSPESIEEMIWEHFFRDLHTEARSNVLDESHQNPAFERFYRDHIRKLVTLRGASRYLTKSNYCILRMRYLAKLFPEASFLLYVRNPLNHIGSLYKQDRLLKKLGQKRPRRATVARLHGRHYFGVARTFANLGTGDVARLQTMQRYADAGRDAVAWAMEWAAVYRHALNVLECNPHIAARTKIVRYEDLCQHSEATIHGILNHCDLDVASFQAITDRYAESLTPPRYYNPDFSADDLAQIKEITAPVAAAFGYETGAATASVNPVAEALSAASIGYKAAS